MAIQTISRIQHRRGLLSDLPTNLNEGEFGWCLDTRQLFIGNGPGYGLNTEVLTQYSSNGQLITNQFRTATTTFISAAQRPLSAKLNDIVSVQDFGATGLGIVDDSVAINTAISSLLQGPYSNPIDRTRNIALKLPAGTYLLDDAMINLFPYTTLIGDGSGKTILLAAPRTTLNPLFQTVDSLGQSTTNIGLNNAVLPHKIVLRDLTINTGNQSIDAIHLNRANNVRFENVEFIGAYVLGNNTDETHTAITLQSFGDAIGCYNFQFVSCWFYNFTYGVYIDDPINHTGAFNCFFTNLYRGWNIGEHYNFNGPSWTVVSGCEFDTIDDSGIIVFSPNPGVTSTSNTFHNVGISDDVLPIVWNTGTTLNTSVADIFDSGPGVLDNGTVDLILDAQQNSINTLVGPTGPSVTGPTGASATGPTGASVTGPTGNIAAILVEGGAATKISGMTPISFYPGNIALIGVAITGDSSQNYKIPANDILVMPLFASSGNAANIVIISSNGPNSGIGNGGLIVIEAGSAGGLGGEPGIIGILSGSSFTGNISGGAVGIGTGIGSGSGSGGNILIQTGNGGGGPGSCGGNIVLSLGVGVNLGLVIIQTNDGGGIGLPSSDPGVPTSLWSDNGVVVFSGFTNTPLFAGNGIAIIDNIIETVSVNTIIGGGNVSISPLSGESDIVIQGSNIGANTNVNIGTMSFIGQRVNLWLEQGNPPGYFNLNTGFIFGTTIPNFISTQTPNIIDMVQIIAVNSGNVRVIGVEQGYSI